MRLRSLSICSSEEFGMKFVRGAIFLLLFLACFIFLNRVFCRSSFHTEKISDFYASSQSEYDVLAFGPSYMYCTFSPPELYRRFGLRSFVMGSPCQPIYETFFFIRRALSKYRPRIVLLGADMICYSAGQYIHKSEFVHEATDGFPLSFDKVSMICNLATNSDIDEFFLPIIKYHDRWKNLDVSNFKHNTARYDVMGHMFYCGEGFTNTVSSYDLKTCSRSMIYGENIRWLEKIRDVVESAGARLVLVSAPRCNGFADGRLATLHDYSDVHGLAFLDLNLDFEKTRISNDSDFYDGGHLNVFGAEKATRYIGEWLMENFAFTSSVDVADRSFWNAIVKMYDAKKSKALERSSAR